MVGFEIIHDDLQYKVAVSPIISEEKLKYEPSNNDFQAKSIKRKCELFSTHKLIEKLLHSPVAYTYNERGKPLLKGRSEEISISHSRNYSAVIVSESKKVGIDIEELNPRIFKISERFLNPAEQEMIEKQEDKMTLLYIIWCAKEALYKLSEISLDFSENIFVEDFTLLGSGTFNAQIIHPEKKEKHILHYKITEKYVLVWVVGEDVN